MQYTQKTTHLALLHSSTLQHKITAQQWASKGMSVVLATHSDGTAVALDIDNVD